MANVTEKAICSRGQTQETQLAMAFSWPTEHALPHGAVKGFPAQLGVLSRGPLLQKETSIYGGSNYIPAEMMLDPPNR